MATPAPHKWPPSALVATTLGRYQCSTRDPTYGVPKTPFQNHSCDVHLYAYIHVHISISIYLLSISIHIICIYCINSAL